ncbi:MAG: AMP-binding protein, partial [Pseudomonadota bacterium]
MTQSFNIVRALAETASATPHANAIVNGKESLSYRELATRGEALRVRLMPVLKSRRVGILGSRSFEAYIAIAGIAAAGAAYVPLNMKWPEARLVSLLQQLELDALIVDGQGEKLLSDAVLNAAPSLVLRPAELVEEAEAGLTPVARDAAETAYIVFTSGTTGEPKGVVVSCGALAEYLANTRGWAGFGPSDRVAEAHDITFDLSVHNVFLAWEAGSAIHLMNALDMMAPQRFIRAAEITCWMSVPTIIAQMQRIGALKPGLFDTLRLSVFCGEPLPLAAVT